MWRPVFLGNISIDDVVSDSCGTWIVGLEDFFFVPHGKKQGVSVVQARQKKANVLGIADGVLFLSTPDNSRVKACFPDGTSETIMVGSETLLPCAVSPYIHEDFSPSPLAVSRINKECYVYFAPTGRKMKVGKYLVAEWDEYNKQPVVVYEKKTRRKTNLSPTKRITYVRNIRVGRNILLIESHGLLLLTTDGNVIRKTGRGNLAIEENTNRIAEYNENEGNILCWEWGKNNYRPVELPNGKMSDVYVCYGQIFVFGFFEEWGMVALPFPSLGTEENAGVV